jgi:hypothetical protein
MPRGRSARPAGLVPDPPMPRIAIRFHSRRNRGLPTVTVRRRPERGAREQDLERGRRELSNAWTAGEQPLAACSPFRALTLQFKAQ